MEKNYFMYGGVKYYTGTIIQVREDHRELFRYRSMVEFVKCDDIGMYCFSLLEGVWPLYKLSEEQLHACIEQVLHAKRDIPGQSTKMEPKYIDGIVEAWTWYLLAMLAAPFVKGIGNVIVIWIFSSIVFFTWRNNKINRK